MKANDKAKLQLNPPPHTQKYAFFFVTQHSPAQRRILYTFQCFGSGSESVWIRIIWQDPDPDPIQFQTIRIRIRVAPETNQNHTIKKSKLSVC